MFLRHTNRTKAFLKICRWRNVKHWSHLLAMTAKYSYFPGGKRRLEMKKNSYKKKKKRETPNKSAVKNALSRPSLPVKKYSYFSDP